MKEIQKITQELLEGLGWEIVGLSETTGEFYNAELDESHFFSLNDLKAVVSDLIRIAHDDGRQSGRLEVQRQIKLALNL